MREARCGGGNSLLAALGDDGLALGHHGAHLLAGAAPAAVDLVHGLLAQLLALVAALVGRDQPAQPRGQGRAARPVQPALLLLLPRLGCCTGAQKTAILTTSHTHGLHTP